MGGIKGLVVLLIIASALIYTSIDTTKVSTDKHQHVDTSEGRSFLSEEPALSAIQNTRLQFDELLDGDGPASNLETVIQANTGRNLAHISEDIEPVFYSHPGLLDVFDHLNLMHGNTISDKDLINSISDERSPLHEAVTLRATLKVNDPDLYEFLVNYERSVIGRLLDEAEINDHISSETFKAYKAYLLNDGVVVPFCNANPKSLICSKQANSVES